MSLFSKTKTVPFEDIRTKEAQALGKTYLQKLQAGTDAYDAGADFGDVNVGLGKYESQSLGYLGDYLNSDIKNNDLYQAGRSEITNTLSGAYNPMESDYYKAMRAEMDLNTQQSIDNARRGQAVRGSFRSSGGLRQEGDILTQSNIAQNQLLGEMYEKERVRKQQAGTQALQLGEFEYNIPLSKTQYAQQYGALERENEIANLTREYNKWSNQRQELMNAFTAAGKASNEGQPVYGKTSSTVRETTGWGKAAQIGGTVIGGIFGGPAGASVGYKIGNALVASGY